MAIEILRLERTGETHPEIASGEMFVLVMHAQETSDMTALGAVPPMISLCRRIEAAMRANQPIPSVSSSGDSVVGAWRVPRMPVASDAVAAGDVVRRFVEWWPGQNPDADGPNPFGWSDAKLALSRRMEAMFAEVWAAACIAFALLPAAQCEELARRVVSMPLPFVPDPDALDLWLQRRAMIALWRACEAMGAEIPRPPVIREALQDYLDLRMVASTSRY